MSTQPNPLQQTGPWGVPGTTPSTVPGGSSSAPSGPDQGGFFSRLGAGLKKVMPYVTPIANRLAAAAGNYGPLELEHQQRAQEMEQQRINLQGQLNNSQLQNLELNRQLLQKQNADYQNHEQKAAQDVATKRAEVPSTYRTDDGQIGIADTDLQGKTSPRMANIPGQTVPNPTQAPGAGMPSPIMPPIIPPAKTATSNPQQTPAVMPRVQGIHYGVDVQNPDGSWSTPVYQNGRLVGNEPTGGTPAAGLNAPTLPGVSKVNPMDVGASGSPLPNPKDYPNGVQDQKFRTDYQAWLQRAAAAKQSNAASLAGARGAAFGANRPLPMLTDEGTEAYGTLASGIKPLPGGGLPLTGNQSGAASLGQRRATFQEVDKNLANMKTALPAVDSLGIKDRAAIVAGLTPGKSSIGQGIEGLGLASLSPGARALVDTTRNLKQGVLSLRNVLTSGGVGSDYRVNILEAEMPNEQDFAASSSEQIQKKLDSFESIYNDIVNSYPQLFTQRQNRSTLLPKPNLSKPQSKPAGKWNMTTGQYE